MAFRVPLRLCSPAGDRREPLLELAAAVGRGHVRFEKIRDPLIGIDLVLHARKAMALILVNLVICESAMLLHRIDNL